MTFGPKILLAIVVLLWWRKLIWLAEKLAEAALKKAKVEKGLRKFVESLMTVILKVMLLITVAGMIGIETTSFVAIIGAASFAVWFALQWSLANFAWWVLILLFKPYKVGQLIEANGGFGTVEAINVFTTTLLSPENKTIIIPNGEMANTNVTNYTKHGNIRVDVNVGIDYSADIDQAKKALLAMIEKTEKVLKSPKSWVYVSELGDSSVNLIVRAYAKPQHYRDVFFWLTESTKKTLDKENIGIPYPHQVVYMHQEK